MVPNLLWLIDMRRTGKKLILRNVETSGKADCTAFREHTKKRTYYTE